MALPTEVDPFSIDASSSLKQRLQSIIEVSKHQEITNPEGFNRMTSLYSNSKEWEKRIEFVRKEANKPDQDRINERNDKAKEILAPLKEIQSIAKDKCNRYQLILERQKRDEEKSVQDALDLLGIEETAEVAPVDKSVRGSGAIMCSRTIRKFRIVAQDMIPKKYFRVDEEAIERDIKLGIETIPGVEIYEEKVTQLRIR